MRGSVQLEHWIPYWNLSMAIWHYLGTRALRRISSLWPFSSFCPFLGLRVLRRWDLAFFERLLTFLVPLPLLF